MNLLNEMGKKACTAKYHLQNLSTEKKNEVLKIGRTAESLDLLLRQIGE